MSTSAPTPSLHYTSHFIVGAKMAPTLHTSPLPPLNTLQPCEPQVVYEATKLVCPYSTKSEPAQLVNCICIALLKEVSYSN